MFLVTEKILLPMVLFLKCVPVSDPAFPHIRNMYHSNGVVLFILAACCTFLCFVCD